MILDFDKMVEELGSIETLKTDFFSDVSHEFKSPLAVISSNAEMLQKGGGLSDEQTEQVENIRYATKRLANLIQNMLKLNKLEKQTIRPMPEVFDVCAQLCDCAVQFEDVWERKDIEFEADLEDSAAVYADAGLAEIVWTNLLSNAFKFTPEGGTVTLTQWTEETCVRVTVTDNGCGMTPDTVKHIFDKFYQGDPSHSTQATALALRWSSAFWNCPMAASRWKARWAKARRSPLRCRFPLRRNERRKPKYERTVAKRFYGLRVQESDRGKQ